VEFRLAGRGPLEQHCRELCERRGLRNVDFLGHLSSAQLGEEMRAADVFFFPSILEGHPQVLIQAIGCGLPVVAMDAYRPDCVLDGKTGFLARCDEELSGRLDLLLTNADLRRKMSAAAVAHSANFDWECIAEKWADLFSQIAGNRYGPSSIQSEADVLHA
jgi:glycosyltransferase involved in cell wall biosynthesis